MTWQCKENHIWQATYNSIQQGSWCNICSSKKGSEKLKHSLSDCVETAKENNGKCLSEHYENSQTKMLWQ